VPSVKPEDIVPDPTGAATFFLCKQGLLSSNYKVHQDDKHGKLWMLLRKHGKWGSDDCLFVLENFVRTNPEKKDEGQALAVCKFDTLDADAYKQYASTSHDDSDNSDGYSIDSDPDDGDWGDTVQRTKWRFKTKSKFYTDRSRKDHVFSLTTKAKGKSRREVDFHTSEQDGQQTTTVSVSYKHKVKKLIYTLTPVLKSPEGAEVDGPGVPVELHGSLNKNPSGLKWVSPMFSADLKGRFIQEVTVKANEGFPPAMSCLIAYVLTIELSPDDVVKNLHLNWPTVYGPNGCSA